MTCLESSGLASHSCQWCAASGVTDVTDGCLADPTDGHRTLGARCRCRSRCRIRWEDPAKHPVRVENAVAVDDGIMESLDVCGVIMWSQSC